MHPLRIRCGMALPLLLLLVAGTFGQSSSLFSGRQPTNPNSGSTVAGQGGTGSSNLAFPEDSITGQIEIQAGAASTNNATGFVGRGNTGFVGRTATQATTAASNRPRQITPNRQTARDNGGGQRGRQEQAQAGAIRVRQQIAFPHPQLKLNAVMVNVRQSFAKMQTRRPELASVSMEVADDGAIVLRGEVKSAAARRLAGALVYLEPGVREVRNELKVAAP